MMISFATRAFVRALAYCMIGVIAASVTTSLRANDQTRWRNVLRAPSYGLAWNPKNPRTIYVGGEARAFYRSFDGGITWDTLYVGMKGAGELLLNVVVHPVDTNIIIVGGKLGTIQRSTDCGATWNIVLKSDVTHTFNGESIIIDKSDNDALLAVDFNNAKVFRSSDRGASWTLISDLPLDSSKGQPRRYYPCCITQRSDSTDVLYLGCLGSTILRSEDHGRTWRRMGVLRTSDIDAPEIPQIHFSRSNPVIGYAITTYFFYPSRPNGGVFKTIDGGLTWKEVWFRDTGFWSMDSRPIPGGGGDELVLGGFTEYFDTPTPVPGSGILLRSMDNGGSWWNYKQDVPYEGGPNNSVITLRFVGNTYASQRLIAATVGGTCILEPEGLAPVDDGPESTASAVYDSRTGRIIISNIEAADDVFSYSMYDVLGRRLQDGMCEGGAHSMVLPFQQRIATNGVVIVLLHTRHGTHVVVPVVCAP